MFHKATFLLLFLSFSLFTFGQNQKPEFAKDQLIIKFKAPILSQIEVNLEKSTFNIPEIDALNQKHRVSGIKMTGNKKEKNAYVIFFQDDRNIEKLLQEFQATGLLEYAEPNFIGHGGGVKGLDETIPDDNNFQRQWGLLNDGSFTLSPAIADADVDMEKAWDIEQGNSSVIVAVLDSGFKLDHPEVNGRIWNNSSEIPDGTDTDNNGYIDDLKGWDFANDDNDPIDDHGHGTNVAGIIGATGNNGTGYAGVDWNCKIMIGKILDSNNSGFYSWWTDAIYYAVDNGAKIINMSVGGSGFSATMETAVNYAYQNGVTITVSMMNFDDNTPYYPAAYANTIGVGSTDANDNRTSPFFWSNDSGSNYGTHIDVVAPGNYIYGLDNDSDTNYNSYWGGTSQAAPLVAGLASLLYGQDMTRSPDDIRSILTSTAEDQIGNTTEDTPGWDEYYGWGRVNAFDALNLAVVNTQEINTEVFKIYPNPLQAEEKLIIEWKKPTDENTVIAIFNSLGQQIWQTQTAPNQSQTQVTIPENITGFYFIYIKKGDDIYNKPLIIDF